MMASLLWLITILLVILWLFGFAVNFGAWIHLLLLIALVLLVFNVVTSLTHHHHDHDELHHM